MIKFEQIGVNLQNESTSKLEAQSKFSRSCEICCNRGIHLECERCAIAVAHKLTVSAIESKEKTETEGK